MRSLRPNAFLFVHLGAGSRIQRVIQIPLDLVRGGRRFEMGNEMERSLRIRTLNRGNIRISKRIREGKNEDSRLSDNFREKRIWLHLDKILPKEILKIISHRNVLIQ